MKTTKIDISIQKKLANLTITPSSSAWERLSLQLDQQKTVRKQKKIVLFTGVAASIFIFISLSFLKTSITKQPTLIYGSLCSNPINVEFNSHSITSIEHQLMFTEIIPQKTKKTIQRNHHLRFNNAINHIQKKIDIHKTFTTNKIPEIRKSTIELKFQKIIDYNKNSLKKSSKVKVNSEALLYAVSHSKEEIEQYYAQNHLQRNEVLKEVKDELLKHGIQIDPQVILTNIEQTIDEESFKSNFIQTIKKQVENMATAIASRNN